jgi:hypothetical protein
MNGKFRTRYVEGLRNPYRLRTTIEAMRSRRWIQLIRGECDIWKGNTIEWKTRKEWADDLRRISERQGLNGES